MAEFVGGEPVSVGVNEPITFESKIDTAFDVGCGIVFRKSGLYRVSIVGRHTSVAVEPERRKGKWGNHGECPFCSYLRQWEDDRFCGNCGADMRGEQE